jgi:hypothetical protein
LAAAALAFAPAASARDVTITSFDGTKIAAHWFPGKGVSAGKPAPSHTKKKKRHKRTHRR